MNDEINALEEKIYDEYYNNGGEDARFGLWKAVIDAKESDDPIKELNNLFDKVEIGHYR